MILRGYSQVIHRGNTETAPKPFRIKGSEAAERSSTKSLRLIHSFHNINGGLSHSHHGVLSVSNYLVLLKEVYKGFSDD